MNVMTLVQQETQIEAETPVTEHRVLAKAQVAGAAVGLIGSVTVALLGALMIVAGWLVADAGVRHWLSSAGSVLFFLTIPLVVLAAYCLDGADKEIPQRRSQNEWPEDDDDLC